MDLAKVPDSTETWEKVVRKLRSGMMPPAGLPRPDKSASDSLASWLENEIDQAAAAHPNPGRKAPFHRLNRAEYQNAIRDLLSVEIDVAALLPPDDAGYGFDNIGGVLKINQPLMERYLSAARRISRVALGSSQTPATSVTVRLRPDLPQYDQVEQLGFGTRGGTLFRHTFPVDAEYVIKLQLGAGAGAGARQLELNIDGERVKLFPISPPSRGRGQPRRRIQMMSPQLAGAGSARSDSGRSEGDRRDLCQGSGECRDRGGARDSSAGPVPSTRAIVSCRWPNRSWAASRSRVPSTSAAPGDTPSRRRILVCRPASGAEEDRCARRILTDAGAPGVQAAGDRCGRHAAAGLLQRQPGRRVRSGHRDCAAAAARLSGVPVPHRIGPAGSAPGRQPSHHRRGAGLAPLVLPVEQHPRRRAAGRWPPRDSCGTQAVLEQQVRRMLADPRSEALVTNFAGQWLYLRNLAALEPESFLFPDFEDSLRQAMRRETELFFDSIVREDRSARQSADGRLHVRQRTAGPPLWHSERVRQPLQARDAR